MMEEDKRTPEEKRAAHAKTKRTFKIAGFAVLAVGIVLTAVGFVDFAASFGSFSGGVPKLFFLSIIGLPMAAAGGMLLTFGYRREVMGYVKNESVPVINELAGEIKPAVKSVTEAVAEGLRSQPTARTCPKCGNAVKEGDRFCDECGQNLTGKKCPDCGRENDPDAKFCAGCGKTF